MAQIFAVADVWDALTSDRLYRPAWIREEALNHIREQAGKSFDPNVVEIFGRSGSELLAPFPDPNTEGTR